MIKLMMLGKLKRTFAHYASNNKSLSFTDRNLLRGIVKKKLKDFDQDYKKGRQHLTLYQKLTNLQDQVSLINSRDNRSFKILEHGPGYQKEDPRSPAKNNQNSSNVDAASKKQFREAKQKSRRKKDGHMDEAFKQERRDRKERRRDSSDESVELGAEQHSKRFKQYDEDSFFELNKKKKKRRH